MKTQTHILNGDALLQQLPQDIAGTKIVCRECMIEGNCKGETWTDIFNKRADFLQQTYKVSPEIYFNKTQKELLKIKTIPADHEINLWFEDDLFCQTNWWFTCYLLQEFKLPNEIYLVRPGKGYEYNFGLMSERELNNSLKNRTKISAANLIQLSKLWNAYQQNNSSLMLNIAQALHETFSFIGPAIYAHIANYLGVPKNKIRVIINELNTTAFKNVFLKFCKQEAIYGFGDIQVKRMFDQILLEKNE